MARYVVLFFAALFAISQAAPRPQDGTTATQQTSTNNSTLTSGGVPSSTSNTSSSGAISSASGTSSGAANSTDSVTIIIPPQLLSSFFSSASSSSGTSGSNSVANNPLSAIISVIPQAISSERQRFGSAVKELVKDNVGAITDTIDTAATTGGRVLSNGVRVLGTWPTFFGQLIG